MASNAPALEQLNTSSGSSASMELRQMMTGYWLSQSIYVIAKLGVADLLANGPQTAEQLAVPLEVDANALYRMLRTLSSYRLFEEHDNHAFGLTTLGRLLQKDAAGSLRSLAIWNGEIPYRAWSAVLHSVTTGQPALQQALDMKLFKYLARQPESGQIFQEAMDGLSVQVSRAVVASYDFSGIKRIVDVGGGQGTQISAILRAHPEMVGTLFDMPSVIDGAEKQLEAAGIADRCEVIAGDFFEFIPEGGDAYILSSVVHDWDDDECLRILQNCRKVMSPGTRLLLVECVLPGTPQPDFSKLLDLQMLVITGGRERTESQFKALLESANFNLTKITSTEVPECIVEAVAAG
jgi:ubiquinone/menaquinone biosynthesis C-methylase UbiE